MESEMVESYQQVEPYEKKTKGLSMPDQSLGGEGLRVPRRTRELQRSQEGCLILNDRNLKLLCQMEGLYEYPQMNKKLYLHYKVIDRIYGLEKYINLKTLYLQNNVIRKIENLQHLPQLENLFLQNNMIERIEGLSRLKQLKIINLSNNNIFTIDGLADCSLLQSLTLSKNYLSDFTSLEHLGQCSTLLTAIDLSDNKIIADQRLFDLIPQVKCLYLGGNPLVRDTTHYRRRVIGRLPSLMYLDQRGVDSQERLVAEAWVREGEAGFKAAREQILALRKQRKIEAKEEIMKNIDVHRKNKINVFEGNILDSERQIEKLRGYIREPGNEDQIFFYQSRIAELMQKIRENQQYIDAIYKRMGLEPLPPIYSLELDPEKKEGDGQNQQQMREGGMFDIRQEEEGEGPSQGQSEGSQAVSNESARVSEESGRVSEESGTSGGQGSNNSQQSSVQTYYSYEELD